MSRLASTRRSNAVMALAVVLALGACDTAQTTPKPSGTQGPASTSSATGLATVPPEATQPADVPLPPGGQYVRGVTEIPGEAEPVVTQFLTRAYFFSLVDGQPQALYREGVPWRSAVIDDGAGYRPPAGATLDAPFRVVGAAANDRAMVVLGSSTTTDHDRPTGLDRLPESVIWLTRDGKEFQRVDPRPLLDDAASLRLTAVASANGGFVAVGNALPKGFDRPAYIAVLRSTDGMVWSLAARIQGDGTLYARSLLADGDRLLVDATDQWCDSRGISFGYGLRTGITVAWSSPDGGSTWSAVDLSKADPVISQGTALIEGCPSSPKLGDLIGIAQGLDTQGSIVGLAGGSLIARSRDGTTLGISRDLTTWAQVVLPDAVPASTDARRPLAQSIILDISGAIRAEGKLALLALEHRADLEGRPQSGGCQVRWWRSADGGDTWSTGPWGRPFSTCVGATWSFEQLLDGSVVLFLNDSTANQNRGQASFLTGRSGQLVAWDTCVPGPDADCSFSTLTNPTSEAPDWPGIDLSGATVTAAEIDGVQMPGADAYAALLSGSFVNADLSSSVLSYAILEGDFSGANLRDASLFNALVRADLTGANLDGAELSGLTFGEGAVCPDGKAPTAGATDAKAACRL